MERNKSIMGCCVSNLESHSKNDIKFKFIDYIDLSVILPKSYGRPTKYVNLGEMFRQHSTLKTETVDGQEKLLALAIEKEDPTTVTFGGYLEDRTELWKNFYPIQKGKRSYHAGCDINHLTPGEPVGSITSGTVVDVYNCQDSPNGWGGRVLVKTNTIILNNPKSCLYVLYGHLDYKSIVDTGIQVGVAVKRGQKLGAVGDSKHNGSWFAHLHVQCMTEKCVIDRYKGNLKDIDGYMQTTSASELAGELIDPIIFL